MSFVTHKENGVTFHTSTLLENGAVRHGFSTRLGGVSKGVYASLNLRRHGNPPDAPDLVDENYRRFCAAGGVDTAGLALSRQVHEDTVRHVTAGDAGKGFSRPVDYSGRAAPSLRRKTGEPAGGYRRGDRPLLLRDTQRRPRRHAYRLRPRGGGVYHPGGGQVARGPEGNQRLAAAGGGGPGGTDRHLPPLYRLPGGSLLEPPEIGGTPGTAGRAHRALRRRNNPWVDGFLRCCWRCCF